MHNVVLFVCYHAAVIDNYCSPAPGPFVNVDMSSVNVSSRSVNGNLSISCSMGFSAACGGTSSQYQVSAQCVASNNTSGFWSSSCSGCTRALHLSSSPTAYTSVHSTVLYFTSYDTVLYTVYISNKYG